MRWLFTHSRLLLTALVTMTICDNSYAQLKAPFSQSETTLGQPLSYPEGTPVISSSILKMAPGARTPLHIHDTILLAYILNGEIEVHYEGGITKNYRTGETVIEAVNLPHWGRNPGDSENEILIYFLGTSDRRLTIELGSSNYPNSSDIAE